MPTTTPFQNLITFSRGSNATVTGPDGLIQWAPHNLLTFSESFDNAAWTKTGATVYANQDFGNGTLGPELVTNGDFASATGWNTGGGWAISGGAASLTAGTAILSQATTTGVAGRWYQVTFTVVSLTSGTLRVEFGGANGATRSAAGTYTEYLLATSTGLLLIQPLSALTATIDNISIKEITPAAAIAPDGTRTADTLVEDTSTGAHLVLVNSGTPGASERATYTVYAKAGTRRFIALGSNTRPNAGAYVAFDLQNGTAGTAFGGSAALVTNSSIISVGNGWYRCQVSFGPSSAGASPRFVVAIVTSLSPVFSSQLVPESYAGNGTGSLLIWGAQLELGSTATTYNPTTVKNLLGFSEAFDNAAWTKLDASIVTGAQANPVNGLFNAQKLMENTANAQHIVQQGFSVTSGTPYVFSVYAKAAGRNRFSLRLGSIAPADNVTFDLSNGTIVTGSAGYVASIVSVGSGWYRCSITSTPSSSGTRQHQIYLNSGSGSGVEIYTGDGSSGVYIYGAQLSDSASLDPYVPTPGAAPSSTAYYGPRFDYDPVTRQPKGILIEEARTNLLTYSQEFDNAYWVKNNATVTANATAAPDGTTTADALVWASATNPQLTPAAVTVSAGASVTLTVYAKAGTKNSITLILFNDGSNFALASFNLATGAAGTPSVTGTRFTSLSASTVNAGNGWYRCILSATTNTLTSLASWLRADTAVGAGDNIFIWGAQLEVGAFATSYIPTIASTVTRSADVATITGSLFSQWYRQDQGAFMLDFSVLSVSVLADVMIASTSGSFNPGSSGIYGSNSYQTYIRSGGAYIANFTATGTTTPNTPGKLAYTYSAASAANSFRGGTVGSATPTSAMPTTVNQLSWFGTGVTGNVQSGHIRSINFIPFRSADFQLQAIST